MRLDEEKKKHTESIVLVVDDNPAARQTIRKILSSSCRVIDSGDPSILANTYQQYLPDMVLVDAESSQSNGHDSLKDILLYDPQAFVVILSDNCTQQAILNGKERGAKGYICKPFKREIVLKYLALAEAHKPKQNLKK